MASYPIRTIGFLLALTAGGCGSSAPLPASGRSPLDPIAFFTGRAHGDGELDKLFSRRVGVTVESVGRRQGDRLILDQTIREGDKPARVRRWTMRPAGPGLYSGTLTEASGPVSVAVAGSRAEIRYRMKGGLDVEQQLALQSDGRTMLNRLTVRKFGVRVAILRETIRKIG